MRIQSICSNCGGELLPHGDSTYKCRFCAAVYREDTVKKEIDALSRLLDEDKREKVSALKRELWKKLSEEYHDNNAIIWFCRQIKQLLPDDFYANFYEAANSGNEDHFVTELECIDVIEHYDDMPQILGYALKCINHKNMLAICNLIERAYKQNDLSLYNEYRTEYDRQCSLLNDCVYDPAYPRDVFVCYSSKDMERVESLVKFLEEQGLLCFVAIRNLQHGRGAVQNYWNAIHTAIENCKCVVFLSSTNSRSLHCDALQELRHVLLLEQKLGRKIKKIEYLLENYTGAPVERNFQKIFSGLEYCYDELTVYDRVMWEEEMNPPAAEPELSTQKLVKYCCNCGKENPDNAKFCFDCGRDEFVATQEEYIARLRQEKLVLEEQRKQMAAAAADAQAAARAANEQVAAHAQAVADAQAAARAADARAAAHAQAAADAQAAARTASEQAAARWDGYSSSHNEEEEDDYFSGRMQFVDVDERVSYGRNTARTNEAPEYYAGSEATELIKGQHVILPEDIRRIKVTIENEYKLDDVTADLFVFLLDGTERVLSESDLVFFGNTVSLNRSVKMENTPSEEVVEVQFNKVNQDISKIRFVLAFNMEDGKIRNFSMLRSSTVRFYLEEEAYCFHMENIGRYESVCAFEFYRSRNRWKLNIQAAGLREDINTLCGDYGIDVE